MGETEDIIAYALSKLGRASTFRLSRTLILLDLQWEKEHGSRRTGLHYGLFPPAFYVEEFPDLLLNMEGIEKVMERDESGMEKGYFVFHTDAPDIDDETKALLDSIIEEIKTLDDHALNMRVVNSEEYRRALEEKGK